MHTIRTLRTHQRCGAVSVVHDSVTQGILIRCVFNFVAHIKPSEGAIDIYGLGDCGSFEINHKRYVRYIKDSDIRVENGVVTENSIRRTRFTRPTTALRLRSVFNLRLSRIELGGISSLKEVSTHCLDREALFKLTLGKGTRLSAALGVMSVRCVLHQGASVNTATELPASRMLWQVTDLELILHGSARVTGVYVTHKLTTTLLTDESVSLDINTSDECAVNAYSQTVAPSHITMMGHAHSPARVPIINEHGMVEFVEETGVPQEALDASRAAYEEEQSAASSVPLFALRGNTKHADEPAADSAQQCRVCMTNKAVAIMTGCGHVATCVACVHEMCVYLSTCPVCRTEIGAAVIPFV